MFQCSPTEYAGTYQKEIDNGNYYAFLTLYSDSTFLYKSNEYINRSKPYMPVLTVPSDSIGEGTYYIKKKKLFLNYEGELEPNVFIDTTYKKNTYIEFEILMKSDSLPLYFTEISYLNKQTNRLEGTTVDFDGKAHFQLQEKDFPIEFNIKYLGFASETIYLHSPLSYHIQVYMYEAPKPLRGQRIYPIKKYKDSIMIHGLKKVFPIQKTSKKKLKRLNN